MFEKMALERIRKQAEKWVEDFDPDWVAAYIKESCREEWQTLEAQSRLLMEQTFVFQDKWDMEPCGEVWHMDSISWTQSPNGDPEWVYMLNRHEYLYKLMLSYYGTGDRSRIGKLKWYLFSWIRENPIVSEGTEALRTIDTGIRMMAWQRLVIHLLGNGFLTEAETEKLIRSIGEQILYLKEHYIGKYTLSNWGILQTTAICSAYQWFGELLPDQQIWQWAKEELKTQLELQVLEDGSHWEQSVMYHIEVMLAVMKLMFTGGTGEDSSQLEICKRSIRRMSRHVLFLAGPDHCQPAQGDSDRTDVRDIFVKAAVLTGDPVYKGAGYPKADLESVWLFGRRGAEAYAQMEASFPEKRALAQEDGGTICIRSSWQEDGDHTFMTCGPLGSSHGHADLTHISLYHKGRLFLTDSGRFTYREDNPLRPYFKSAQAHNVCVVDGESQWRPVGAWGYEGYPECLKNYFRSQGGVSFGEMAYHEKLPQGADCLVIRRVMYGEPGIWLIVNDICCSGTHEVKEYYHLDPEVEAGKTAGLLLESGGVRLQLYSDGSFHTESCRISRRYNEQSETSRLVRSEAFKDRYTSWMCLCAEGIQVKERPVYQYGSEKPAPAGETVALSFELPSGECWDFLVWNRETCQGGKMYLYEGRPIYGKAAAFYSKDGKTDLYRLKI